MTKHTERKDPSGRECPGTSRSAKSLCSGGITNDLVARPTVAGKPGKREDTNDRHVHHAAAAARKRTIATFNGLIDRLAGLLSVKQSPVRDMKLTSWLEFSLVG